MNGGRLEQHVVVPVVLGHQGDARTLGAIVPREIANKVFRAERIRSNHFDVHAQRVAQQEHFHLKVKFQNLRICKRFVAKIKTSELNIILEKNKKLVFF